MAFTMITLTAGSGYRLADGSIPRARIKATPIVPMTNGTTTVDREVSIPLSSSGVATKTIAATDDTSTLPTGNAYRFRVEVDGQVVQQFTAALPKTPTTRDISTLTALDEVPALAGVAAAAAENIRDVMAAALVAGANVTITPNDGADTITIASTGGGGGGGAVSSVNGNTGAVVLNADSLADGSTKVMMLATERTKLSGITTGATAYTDEMARDALGTALTAGSGITITPSDGADTITIAATGGGSSYTAENARDDIGAALVGGAGVEVTVSDASDTITLTSTTTTQNAQTGTTYTLAIGDAGKVVEMNNAAANTLTVPPNSSVAFATGTVFEAVQMGAGVTTIAAGSGVTIRTPSTLILRTRYSSVALRKRGTDEWVLSGDVQ